MTSTNLSIVFGPTILAPRVDSIEASLMLPRIYPVVQSMLTSYESIFQEPSPTVPDELSMLHKLPSPVGPAGALAKLTRSETSSASEGDAKLDDRARQERLERISKRMSDPRVGVEVKDHRLLFKTHRNTFVASEAVDWLLADGPGKSRTEAIKLGQELLLASLISSASRTETAFDDSQELYRFGPHLQRSSSFKDSSGNITSGSGEAPHASLAKQHSGRKSARVSMMLDSVEEEKEDKEKKEGKDSSKLQPDSPRKAKSTGSKSPRGGAEQPSPGVALKPSTGTKHVIL